MSTERRRTEIVYSIIKELFAAGQTAVRPGDVNSALRIKGSPMGTWEVRAEFTRLEDAGQIVCDADSGQWYLSEGGSLKDTGS